MTPTALPLPPLRDGLANWQWLAHLPVRNTALVVLQHGDASDWFLAEGFKSVQRILASEAWGEVVTPHAIDCVCIPDVSGISTGTGGMDAVIEAARRVLRPETGTYVGVESLHEKSAYEIIGRTWRQRQSSHAMLLSQAGFRDVREYYVVPSIEIPRHLIPADRTALRAWNRAISGDGWKSLLRDALYAIGAGRLLLRHRLVLARA